jgi:hypothetical protein
MANQSLANQKAIATAEAAQNLQTLLTAPTVQGDLALNPVGTNLFVRNYGR